MLINPFLHNLLEKNIFDIQITIDRVHHVKFQVTKITSSLLTLCEKHKKCRKNDLSYKNRGLVPTIQPEPDFS